VPVHQSFSTESYGPPCLRGAFSLSLQHVPLFSRLYFLFLSLPCVFCVSAGRRFTVAPYDKRRSLFFFVPAWSGKRLMFQKSHFLVGFTFIRERLRRRAFLHPGLRPFFFAAVNPFKELPLNFFLTLTGLFFRLFCVPGPLFTFFAHCQYGALGPDHRSLPRVYAAPPSRFSGPAALLHGFALGLCRSNDPLFGPVLFSDGKASPFYLWDPGVLELPLSPQSYPVVKLPYLKISFHAFL